MARYVGVAPKEPTATTTLGNYIAMKTPQQNSFISKDIFITDMIYKNCSKDNLRYVSMLILFTLSVFGS